MRLIQEAADRELVWRQPSSLKQEYELRAEDEVLATLRWHKALGSLATARTAEGAWTFKRSGFWRQRVGVRPVGEEREIASFAPGWTGDGTLTVAGGRTFHWAGKSIVGLQKRWQEREDMPPLVGFAQQGVLRTEAGVVLSVGAAALAETVQLDELYDVVPPEAMVPPATPLAELPLLVTLGFYLLVLEVLDAVVITST